MDAKSLAATAGKPIRCRAALCRGPNEALVIQEIEVHPPKAYEIRIKIICTSLCHSDVFFSRVTEGPFAKYPKILGHEAVGVVESVGEHAEGFAEGDVILPVFHPNCEECRDCRSAKSNMCSKFPEIFGVDTKRDGTSRFSTLDGQPISHTLFVSSFSEYTVVDIIHAVKISPDIPADVACLFACGVSTGIGAAWKVADVEEGSTVAIFGLGAVGLAVAEGARVRGASVIIGVDLNPDKFQIGKKFGVTDFIDPSACQGKRISEDEITVKLVPSPLMLTVKLVIVEMTGDGADYCFECIGSASLMNEAFSSLRKGGSKTIILGVEAHRTPLAIDTYDILRGRTVAGSLFGGMKPKSDIPLLIRKYLDKEINLDGFITHGVGFGEINKAFELLLGGKCIRCTVWMDG